MLPWMLGHAPLLAFFMVLDIALPFLLAGVFLGWIYRSMTGQGFNFYQGFLDEYGVQGGLVSVVLLMVASSVVSMGIRQVRHLAEKPTDFFRLPVFILISTFFLMPIRLFGFFRMAHASGWGTRAGAYAGGTGGTDTDLSNLRSSENPASSPVRHGAALPSALDPEFDPEFETEFAEASSYPGDDLAVRLGFDDGRGQTPVLQRPVVKVAASKVVRRTRPIHRHNLKVGIPYLIGFSILILEAFFIV